MINLRPLTNQDVPFIAQYLNNQNVTRYLSSNIPYPYTIEDAQWFVDIGSKQQAINQAIIYNDKMCGVIGVYLQQSDYAHTAELGYWIGEQFWGKGIATQSVIQFCQQLFVTTQISRIYNPVTAQNIASCRVLEKAGFQLEGILKQSVNHQGIMSDERLYALAKEDEKTR